MPINTQTLPRVDANTNRFLTSPETYQYDADGNLVQDANGRQFIFNGDNKQIEVKDASNNPVGRYYYDGNGKRVKKVTNTETVIFVYDAMGKLTAEYSTATPTSNPTTNYTATDPLGSPRVITNKQGQIVSRRDFMPFGEEVAPDANYRKADLKYGSNDNIRQKFTGYQRDEETGLDFAEARYYNNNHGRFTAVDPLLASGKSANPQTFNRYAYTMNRPLILTDSTGLQAGKKAPPQQVKPANQQLKIKVNSVKVFDGTFPNNPSTGSDVRGKAVATTTGTPEGVSGAYISVDYTLQNSKGEPVKNAQIFEDLSVSVTTIVDDEGVLTEEKRVAKSNGGKVTDNPTDKDGNFVDEPLGGSADSPVKSIEATQTLYIMQNGKRQNLVTNKLKITTDFKVKDNKLEGRGNTTVSFSNPNHNTEIKDIALRRTKKPAKEDE